MAGGVLSSTRRPAAEAELVRAFREFCAGRPFVRARGGVPATKDAAHTNFLDLTVRAVRGRVVVPAAEDDLVRGASGVAVQNFNLTLGYDERLGLG